MADIVSNSIHAQRIKEKNQMSLDVCKEKISQWEKFKADYVGLQERLVTLPDKLSYDVMVPFGPHAFMPANIVHTNTITVLLGDNWFANVSAKQASEIAGRRMKQCDKMLSDLTKEKAQLENWLSFISDVTNRDLADITEEYDPEKEKLWREQHAKNMREYKQKVANDKSGSESISQGDNRSIDEYFERLDELAEEEYEKEELEEDISTDSSEEAELEEEELENETETASTEEVVQEVVESGKVSKEEQEETPSTDRGGESPEERNVNHFSDSTDEKDDATPPVLNGNSEASSPEARRHVRWSDLSEATSKRITFTHCTARPTQQKKKNRRRRRSSSTSELEEEENEEKSVTSINSPSDIYKCFSYSILQSKPKSILKTINSSPAPRNEASSVDSTSSEKVHHITNDTDSKENLTKPEAIAVPKLNKVFSGEIHERSPNGVHKSESNFQNKSKSLFKKSRNSVKR